MKALLAAAAAAVLALVGCERKPEPPVNAASSATLPPSVQAALDRVKAQDAAKDQAADAKWSGSAAAARPGPVQAGNDLTSAERGALADLCRQVAHAEVDAARIRVVKGPPNARITCMLASGAPITIRVDADGNPHPVR